jgi:hypothetical protein
LQILGLALHHHSSQYLHFAVEWADEISPQGGNAASSSQQQNPKSPPTTPQKRRTSQDHTGELAKQKRMRNIEAALSQNAVPEALMTPKNSQSAEVPSTTQVPSEEEDNPFIDEKRASLSQVSLLVYFQIRMTE